MVHNLRVLVTGFGPFPGVERNPTAWLVNELAQAPRGDFAGIDLSTHVFAVEWNTIGAALDKIIRAAPPHLAIHFGVSARAQGFCLETLAVNERESRIDHRGALCHERAIVRDGPDSVRSSLPVEALYRHLQACKLPVEMSQDAGRYLCNCLTYLSVCTSAQAQPKRLTGFVHIPPLYFAQEAHDGAEGDLWQSNLNEESLLMGAREILTFCTDWYRARIAV